jgi:hypothetical protein
VRAYNGALALSSPISVDLDCVPKAEALVKAIGQCDDTITLSMTPGGKLRIVSGPYKAFVDCVEGETPHVEPAGQEIYFDGEQLLNAVKILMPFVGDDASRPWTNGILLRGQSAFATNNVMLCEYWLGTEVPFVVNIPRAALKEMIRVNEPPTHVQLEQGSITFHYSDQRWIRTQLLVTTWPELTEILDKPSDAVAVDQRIFDALEKLKGSADGVGRVYIKDEVMSTSPNAGEGATYDVPGLMMEGCYQIHMLERLKGVATHADFSLYPKPSLFFGDRLRGAIVGMAM